MAEQVGGVIVNADSAQVYRDLPILSAAPRPNELARAEHRLYGVLDGSQACSAADWAALSARWREDLDQRIEKLLLLRNQLDGCIGCGCLSLEACPLRNLGDHLAARGPGAHWGGGESGA